MLMAALAVTAGTVLGSAVRAAAPLAVYTGTLKNGWKNYSWTKVNLSNTTPVHGTATSIAVTAKPWGGLYFHHDAFTPNPYTTVTFWAYGTPSDTKIQVIAFLKGKLTGKQTALVAPAGKWTQFTVPLGPLGAAQEPTFDGFAIQDGSGKGGTFYVDGVWIK